MPKDGRYDDLAAFLRLRGDALMRTAVLLAPGREGGEDLLQEALERIMGKWHKIDGDPEGYLRRIMYSRAVDGWRSRSRRPEVLGLPDDIAVADHSARMDLRLDLTQALASLTPRQRATIVARYWEQLSEAETAAALGCSVGAVKQAVARGLRALREAITPGLDFTALYPEPGPLAGPRERRRS
jgi:RNA polymerase sigma-70 factor (sigma-E family)